MDLNKFTETYFKLEDKVLKIMAIYGIGGYDLDSITLDENNDGKTLLNIKASIDYCGYSEREYLTFDLEEMNNNIDYLYNEG